MVKVSVNKSFIKDFLKGSLISIIIGVILLLVFAIVLNFVPLSEPVVTVINQVIKIITVFLGCLFGFKEKKDGILKGLISGVIYSIGIFLISGIINKELNFTWGVLLDIGLSGVIGAICGIITVNIGKNKY